MSKNAVLFAIEAAKVGGILRMAKNRPSITCKNLLTKRSCRLKKSETPIHKGITAYMVFANDPFNCRKPPI